MNAIKTNSSKNNGFNNSVSIFIIVVITALLTAWLLLTEKDNYQPEISEHGHEAEEEEVAKGPHGGRLLSQEGFELEITIFERGLPPEFRVYVYQDGQPLSAEKVKLDIELERTGNKVDHIQFNAEQDYLRGNATIYEPHSFEVVVKASYLDKTYTWRYDNFEGRTEIPVEVAGEMGIRSETVGAQTINDIRTFTGRVQANPNRMSRVRPRFAGVVKKVHVELGESVKAGDVLATVQSNESLQNYNIKAPIAGLIVKRDVQVGEATGEIPLFVIIDHSDVWVELDIFVRDLAQVKKGQRVIVETLDANSQITANIDWVSPLTSHASQSVRARLTVSNKDGIFRPGQFIRGHVTIAKHEVALAVKQSALQSFRDFQVVYARFDDVYEVRMLELGRRNRDWVEVLGGIEVGIQYVTENSYLIKADIEKSGATHDH
jgi:cobalt-zinc-cadmium efflux system membrane fusion protein